MLITRLDPAIITADKANESAIKPQRTSLWLILLLHAVLFLVQLPTIYDFATFVLFDPGVTLRTNQLITQGLVPTIDFGYPYGLLPLMLGRLLFALLGLTPAAYIVFMFLAEAVILFGLWCLTRHFGWIANAFILAALPHIVIPVYLHLTHPLEAALIIFAMVQLARGRQTSALALATVSLFVKPVMGYVFGFFVILFAVIKVIRKQEKLASLLAMFWPSALAGAVCALVSILRFGFTATCNALFPTNGAQSYQALNFGFFGNGRTFWLPNLETVAQFAQYYLFTPAGFWLVCTLLAAIFGILSLRNWWKTRHAHHETILIGAACHFIFIFKFFGWPGSWTYYSALLLATVILGLMAHRVPRAAIYALMMLAVLGHVEKYKINVNAWRQSARTPASAGLWSFPDLRDEWTTVRAKASGQTLFYLNNGCAEVLFSGIEAPPSFFLSPDTQTPIEIARIRQKLSKANFVVTFNQAQVLDSWNWKDFTAEREAFQTAWQGKYLTLHVRNGATPPRSQP